MAQRPDPLLIGEPQLFSGWWALVTLRYKEKGGEPGHAPRSWAPPTLPPTSLTLIRSRGSQAVMGSSTAATLRPDALFFTSGMATPRV